MTTTIFTATDSTHGTELWRTDGTAAGTSMIVDLKPGSVGAFPSNGGYTPFYSAVGNVFFTYDDGTHGTELWATDGSAAGTRLVKDLTAGSAATTFGEIFSFGNRVFFSADIGDGKGKELYVSDGTPDGTGLVADLNTVFGSDPTRFIGYSGKVYFTANRPSTDSGGSYGGGTGAELFVTDGTAAGTHLVVDLVPGSRQSTVTPLGVVGGKLFLDYTDNYSPSTRQRDDHIAVTDGTAAGTTTFTPTTASGGKLLILGGTTQAVGNQLYFDAYDLSASSPVTQLWVTDGTAGGTHFVDTHAIDSSTLGTSVVLGDKLIFRSNDAASGSELFVTDAAGTRLLKDIYPGLSNTTVGGQQLPNSSLPTILGVKDGLVYLTANDGVHGRELWSTDGTAAGTQLVRDVQPSPGATGLPRDAKLSGGTIFFDGDNGANGEELWMSDGTTNGTALVSDINAQLDHTIGLYGYAIAGAPTTLFPVSGGVAFPDYTQASGIEPWITDGTLSGTHQLAELFAGTGGGVLSALKSFGGPIIFNPGRSLWIADDDHFTNARSITPSTIGVHAVYGNSAIGPLLGTTLMFTGYRTINSNEIDSVYVTDGTPAGTHLLRTAGGQSITVQASASYTQVGGRALIDNYYVQGGLYSSDGTDAGTVQIGKAGLYYAYGGKVGAGAFYFESSSSLPSTVASASISIVATDGTAAGTQTVTTLPSGAISRLFAAGSAEMFVEDGHLWRTDGTAVGTYRLFPDDNSTFPATYLNSFAGEAGQTYFVASDSVRGSLWVTDGTSAGTRVVNTDFPAVTTATVYFNGQIYFATGGPLYAANADGTNQHVVSDALNVASLKVANGQLYATAKDSANGLELWRSDGTAAGTVRLTDTFTNPSSIPANFTQLIAAGEFAVAAPSVKLAHDNGLSATDTVTNDAALSVTPAVSGGSLAYVVDGVAVSSYNPASLGQGAHTVTVTQTDDAGQISAPGTISFTLDTVAPVNTVDTPTDRPFETGTPTVVEGHGSAADAGGRVQIVENGVVLGTGGVANSGGWAATITLGPGEHHLTAVLTDLAGNAGSAAFDVTAVTPANTAPVAAAVSVSTQAHAIAFGNVVADSVTDPDAARGDTVTLTSIRFAGGADHPIAPGGSVTIEGEHGTLQAFSDGHYRYVGSVAGTDPFSYTVTDSHGASGTGTFSANVLGAGTPVSDQTFQFNFKDANVAFIGSEVILAGPDGVARDATGIGHLHFLDGNIDRADGAPLVDDLYYYAYNKDVYAAGIDADAHYADGGFREGRDPNAIFSNAAYSAANLDVAAAGINPLAHYDASGWKEGRDASPAFSSRAYLALNGDVAASGLDPLAHYLAYGQVENRIVLPGADANGIAGAFDTGYYLAHNPDVKAAGIDPLTHFLQSGWQEGRDPDAFFSTTGYLQANPDVAAAGLDPLVHYELYGWKEGRSASGFNTSGYLAANPDVAAAQVDPLQHFLQAGQAEGRHGWEV